MAVPDWRRLFLEAFDPKRTLRGEDLRYYVSRPDAPSDRILQLLSEDPGAPKFFLAGSPGSGKSTELAELGRRLWDTWAVVAVDADASAANVADVSATELLFMMGAAACKTAVDLGFSISEPAQQALIEAFRGVAVSAEKIDGERLIRGTATFVAATSLAAHGGGAGIPAAATVIEGAMGLGRRGLDAVRSIVTVPPFGGLTRELREADPEVGRLAQAVSDVLGELGRVRRPVVLVDGLDRIEAPDAVRRLFLQTRLLDVPPCPVVYNGPIFLWLNPDILALGGRFERCPLPNAATERPVPGSADVTDATIAKDRAMLRDILERRLSGLGVSLAAVFPSPTLDYLLDQSGGVVRDLLQLAYRACRLASRMTTPPTLIDLELAEKAVHELAREVQPSVANLRAIEELRTVERTGRPSGTDESLRLLLRGAVLAYDDHLPWFRVHPLLRPLLAPTGDG